MSYAAWLKTKAPATQQGRVGGPYWTAVGQILDAQRDQALQAVLSQFPTQGALDTSQTPAALVLPPSDALDAIGYDRGLPRAASESPADSGGARDQAYAARLLAAWSIWAYGGSHYGILRALQLAGYSSPGAIIVQDNGRYSTLTGGAGTVADITFGTLAVCADRGRPGWTFDARTDFYSRFGLVFTSMPAALSTPAGQSALNALVHLWRPAKALFAGTWVITSARIWGFAASPPTLPTWGTGNWGGASTFISPNV